MAVRVLRRKEKAENTALKAGTQSEQRSRPKLLVCIVNRGSGKRVRSIIGEISACLTFSFSGYGTARSQLLDYLGLGETEKTVIFSLFPEGDEDAIMRELRAQLSLYLAGRGIAFSVPLAGVSEIVANGLASGAKKKSVDEAIVMKQEDRKYNLIIAAVNAGHVDEAMKAARAAGASGGTVVRANAIDNQKAEQFIGISIMREQELLLIIAKKEGTQAIMDALSAKAGLKTPAGGVIYCLPVDRTAGISVDEEEEGNA